MVTQCLFELCAPRTHGAQDSKRDRKKNIFASTAGAHCAIFPKLSTVIELVVPVEKGVSYRVHGKIWPNLPTRGFSAITP